MYTEKTYTSNMFGDFKVIELANNDGTISAIPADPANSDYQRYLRWLENPNAEEGGTL